MFAEQCIIDKGVELVLLLLYYSLPQITEIVDELF